MKTAESSVLMTRRSFRWLICQDYDDRANVATYHYKREAAADVDTTSVEESNRLERRCTADCYPDRMRYGNLKPFLPTLSAEGVGWPGLNDVQGPQWIFSVIFDYTSASSTRIPSTAPTDISQRHLRVDPFSTHRAGFEVRTYRLCHRVLMFHHFEELGATKYLVRSTDFEYDDRTDLKDLEKPGYSVLKSVTQRAYQKRSHNDATYESCPLPPVGFTYSEPRVDETVQTSESSDLEIF